MSSNEYNLNEIIRQYMGTSEMLSTADLDWLGEHGLCEAFDAQIFQCECCGYWCPSEENRDQECVDCSH